MTRTRSTATVLALLLVPIAGACSRDSGAAPRASARAAASPASPAASTSAATDAVARGKMLVTMGACGDCHTPMHFDPALGMPVPDMSRYLSGHPEGAPDPEATPGAKDQAVIGPTFTSFKTGFGVVYARNLTPDPDTGLGRWTEAEFVATMRTGHRKGSERIVLPPMPWMNLRGLPDADLHAIYAYLRSLPAIHNQVPDPKVPAPALAAIEQSYARLAKGAGR